MNKFAKTIAGLFVVIGPKSDRPLEAERICSALIQKLLEDPSRKLDPGTWQNAVQMVPSQVESAIISQTLNRTIPVGDLPGALASICVGVVGGGHAPNLTKPVTSYLSEHGEPTAFNCLVLDQTDTAEVHVSLTCQNVKEGHSGDFSIASTQLSASLALSNKRTQTIITKVFSSFDTPGDEPFYLRIFT
ncbi:glutamate acetyltransferase [Sinorhizobium meliloti]|nr:glutamate acetyltransferase [Sinorhizobium meliloti]MDW9372165.1 glutamate acetyltransferase [Sinorhizobium meliloti]MDW9401067.1 glutamate acetyltransferase [Sinorhizobium meliloti]MDW9540466.1 glutamate acetyltransferase [Sinorhizobium meliloti]MDW9615451.1 glutamate acetyltransferase [Sinorhizobium meliloti]